MGEYSLYIEADKPSLRLLKTRCRDRVAQIAAGRGPGTRVGCGRLREDSQGRRGFRVPIFRGGGMPGTPLCNDNEQAVRTSAGLLKYLLSSATYFQMFELVGCFESQDQHRSSLTPADVMRASGRQEEGAAPDNIQGVGHRLLQEQALLQFFRQSPEKFPSNSWNRKFLRNFMSDSPLTTR